jgi:hypothetical protein
MHASHGSVEEPLHEHRRWIVGAIKPVTAWLPIARWSVSTGWPAAGTGGASACRSADRGSAVDLILSIVSR